MRHRDEQPLTVCAGVWSTEVFACAICSSTGKLRWLLLQHLSAVSFLGSGASAEKSPSCCDALVLDLSGSFPRDSLRRRSSECEFHLWDFWALSSSKGSGKPIRLKIMRRKMYPSTPKGNNWWLIPQCSPVNRNSPPPPPPHGSSWLSCLFKDWAEQQCQIPNQNNKPVEQVVMLCQIYMCVSMCRKSWVFFFMQSFYPCINHAKLSVTWWQ